MLKAESPNEYFMKENIFIKRSVMAISIAIVISLVGYISLNTLPVEQYPNIAPPTVEVTTSYRCGREHLYEIRHPTAGRADQRCAGYDLHDGYRFFDG